MPEKKPGFEGHENSSKYLETRNIEITKLIVPLMTMCESDITDEKFRSIAREVFRKINMNFYARA